MRAARLEKATVSRMMGWIWLECLTSAKPRRCWDWERENSPRASGQQIARKSAELAYLSRLSNESRRPPIASSNLGRPRVSAHVPIAMAALTYTEAFRAFGAKLANPMWAYSAIAVDGAMVLSCWSHKLKLSDGVLSYNDRLSRWEPNTPGKNLLIRHLRKARDESLPIRLVVATTDQSDVVDRGEPADKIKKTFHVKAEVVGRVTLFDGDNFQIEFRRS